MSDTAGYRAPTCADCGHEVGDHKSNRSAVNPGFGICLRDGCDCRKFREKATDLDHQQPEIDYFFACGWCGAPMFFTLVTPQ